MSGITIKKIGEGFVVDSPKQQLERLINPMSMREALYAVFDKDWNVIRRIAEAENGEVFKIGMPLIIEVSADVAKIAIEDYMQRVNIGKK